MSSTATGVKQYGLPVKVAVVLLIFVQMTQALCNPSLAGIMMDFPGVPVPTVQTIINIATLVMIPAALVTGPIVNKIGYKTTGIIAMIIALVGGVLPAFVHPSVEFMIVERGIFGIGYGMVYTLSIAACGEFWRGKATTAVVGAVNFGAGLAGILYNLLAASLASMGWVYIYYGYFIIIPILVYYAIVMPQHSELAKEPAAQAGAEKKQKVTLASFGTQFWLFIVGMALALMAACVFMNNIAMVVGGMGVGVDPALAADPAAAAGAVGASVATIMTGFTVGMMIGGAAYPFLYGALKRAAMGVYLLLDVVCFILLMMFTDLVAFIILAIIIGIVFSGLNSAWGDMANKKVVDYPMASATGTSIFIAVAGVAQFISPFVMTGLTAIGGQTETNVFYQYYPAIIILAAGCIILFVMAAIKKNKVDYEREESPAETAAAEAAAEVIEADEA